NGCPINRICAIGTPLARVFLEPQKNAVFWSARLKPIQRGIYSDNSITIVNKTEHAKSNNNKVLMLTSFHSPATTALLKAPYTTSKIEPWSKTLTSFGIFII